MIKAFVNLNKQVGMSSSDAVIKVRGILRRATGEKIKVGHLGTLDPLAEGVLPIAVGAATKLFDFMLKKRKRYLATFVFGKITDTLDREGEIVKRVDVHISRQQIIAALENFSGEQLQIPPQYSAKSKGGQRAYEVAREGGYVALEPVKICIYDIKLIENYDKRPLEDGEFAFEITCSSGTYIRAIARDLAEKLGTVGYMSSLVRIESGPFAIKDSVTLSEFEKAPLSYLTDVEDALTSLKVLYLDEGEACKALNGVRIACDMTEGELFRVKCGDTLIGLGEVSNGKLILKVRL